MRDDLSSETYQDKNTYRKVFIYQFFFIEIVLSLSFSSVLPHLMLSLSVNISAYLSARFKLLLLIPPIIPIFNNNNNAMPS